MDYNPVEMTDLQVETSCPPPEPKGIGLSGCFAILLFLAIVSFSLIYVFDHFRRQIPQIPFNQELWLSLISEGDQPGKNYSIRQQMIRSLVTDVLPGKSFEAAKGLLIPPGAYADSFAPGSNFNVLSADIGYEIVGIKEFLSRGDILTTPCCETLYLAFDANGTFASWQIFPVDDDWPMCVGVPGNMTYNPFILSPSVKF